jgi:hypothetical protein
MRSLFRLCAVVGLISVVAASQQKASGQAFQNLNFEQTVVSQLFGSDIATVSAWRFSDEIPLGPPIASPPGTPIVTTNVLRIGIHLGFDPLQRTVYSPTPTFPPLPFPFPPTSPPTATFFNTSVEGQFSILMRSSLWDFAAGLHPWMEQTGVVPAGTQSIRLQSVSDLGSIATSDGWSLTMDGVSVPVIKLPDGRYSGDISAHAGMVRTMRIAINTAYGADLLPGAPPGTRILEHPFYKFDAFHFSPLAFNQTPEPSSATLLLVGMASLMRRRERSRRRDTLSIESLAGNSSHPSRSN